MCPRRLLPFSVTRGLEYSTETVAGPICWVTVARWLSPLGGRDSPSARATLENNPHVQRKVLFMATGITPYAYHRINARIPKQDGRSAESNTPTNAILSLLPDHRIADAFDTQGDSTQRSAAMP